jgi:hypothetical protein
MRSSPFRPATRASLLVAAALLAGACTTIGQPPEPPPVKRSEVFFAVTTSNQLISFNAGEPQKLLSKKPLTGLPAGAAIAGIDYRVAKGVLFALSRENGGARLYTIDTASGKASPVGAPLAAPIEDGEVGFDFNPTVDRIRVVTAGGQNLRLHPDTGAIVDANPDQPGLQQDGRLAYAPGDRAAGKKPTIIAAGYTYNKTNDKITTNYAIDGAEATLVFQGSKEGVTPVVSPNTGLVTTVGKLGLPPFTHAAFDIADTTGAAFLAVRAANGRSSQFHLVNLDTGAATFMGSVGGGEAIVGMSFEP